MLQQLSVGAFLMDWHFLLCSDSLELYIKLCEKPTPLGVGWIAQNKKVYVDIENIHIL